MVRERNDQNKFQDTTAHALLVFAQICAQYGDHPFCMQHVLIPQYGDLCGYGPQPKEMTTCLCTKPVDESSIFCQIIEH